MSHTQVTRVELPLRAMMVVAAPPVLTAASTSTSGEHINVGGLTNGGGYSNVGGYIQGGGYINVEGVGLLVVDRVGKACYVNPLHIHSPGVTGTAAAAATTGALTSTLAG